MAWRLTPETNEEMVDTQIASRGVSNPDVLRAMRKVDRALFVPPELRHEAYADAALPVAHGQTISQPYIVGLMTEALHPHASDYVLEIGCGTGYQTAILAELVREVWSIELIPELAVTAKERLERLGYHNVHVLVGDGWQGRPERAPFDKIIVTAAPEVVPEALLEQLKIGGIMVVPVGVGTQELLQIVREAPDKWREQRLGPVRFVPMVHGEAS